MAPRLVHIRTNRSDLNALHEIPKQSVAPFVEHVEDGLEPLRPAVIGVRHVPLQEAAHMSPASKTGVRPETLKRGEIVTIHGKDQVEPLEVGSPHLPGAQAREIDAVARGDLDGAWIGRLARMPVSGAGGIDQDAPLKTRLDKPVAQDALGQRRAADVSKADE